MIDLEQLKLFLPKYLSKESEDDLFRNLKDFPSNIDARLYTRKLPLDELIYQADGIENLLVVNFPDKQIGEANSMVLSNTCDIDQGNIRLFSASICYTPIFNLQKFIDKLLSKPEITKRRVNQFVSQIKKQRITQIFYLPVGGRLSSESFVFFDKINNCDNKFISRQELKTRRLFTLSNYGFYLFLFKLSIHFTRIREDIDRI